SVIGAGAGLLNNNKNRRLSEQVRLEADRAATLDAMNYGQRLNLGGRIKGGKLTPISPDVVEVTANNPSQTDSVELSDVFVDNEEIIVNKNRVFCVALNAKSCRTIASEP